MNYIKRQVENKFKLVKFKGRFSSEDGDIIERDVSIQIEKIVELKFCIYGLICIFADVE